MCIRDRINLLTAFLAAAVVGLFEGTIAKFTALAVLLPVVAVSYTHLTLPTSDLV